MGYKIKNGIDLDASDVITNETVSGKSTNECIKMLDECLYERWQRNWDECVNGRVTYEYIKDVRFADRNVCFDPCVYACFLLTGHGSMNAFLYERGLSDSDMCACGEKAEDWKHVLCECRMYNDLRDLDACGVSIGVDGRVDVSRVLECKESYERFCEYAVTVFKRRKCMRE